MPFPHINYQRRIVAAENHLPKGPRAMITMLVNRGLISADEMQDITNMQMLKDEIVRRIQAYQLGDPPDPIFHLIHIWGGSTGRNIYVHGGGFNRELVMPHYEHLIQTCLAINEITEASMYQILNEILMFNGNVANISISFITKHIHFWLCRNLGENSLPIYDSVMASHIMQRRTVRFRDVIPFWSQMIDKAAQEHISLNMLEELLFDHYRPYHE